MIKTVKKNSVSFYTLGCRLNQSETAVIENSFRATDYTVVDAEKPSDIVVINTCTVTEHGDTDTRRLVNKVIRLNPHVKIALVGCQAQTQKEKLTALPNVRWVVGNARKMELAEIFEELKGSQQTHVITPTITRDSFKIPFTGVDSHHTRANIKIQDGCDFFCSFCEIPYARGRARSREFTDILNEAKTLVSAGHKELVITGINVGTYRYENKNLLDVISALEQITGLERIRISSIEPTTIPEDFLKKMANGSKLCRYLHIPLQSGDDEILQLMKRKYSFSEFLQFISKANDLVPQVCIGTDIIVGFPGETEEHFRRTYDRLLEAPIHYFHVFSYSERTMNKSRVLPHPVATKDISRRSQILRDLSQRKRRIYHESLLGTNQKVIFEQKKQGSWSGLTDNYVRVHVKSAKNLGNTSSLIKITAIESTFVRGELLSI